MKVLYEHTPEKERQAAEEHAKRLLRTTDAAPKRELFGTLRDALDTEYKRTKNVVAVLVYDDGHGTWWSDVVFRKGSTSFNAAYPVLRNSRRLPVYSLLMVVGWVLTIKPVLAWSSA